MVLKRDFNLSLPLFVDRMPADVNGFKLRAGAWKFNFDEMSAAELEEFLKTVDTRPQWCSEVFKDFENLDIVEFGPADGYNTAQLEMFGPKSIVAIDANADNYIKCLILKNALGLKAKFLLGNFLDFLAQDSLSFDCAYASGVLYHLEDPVGFIERCARFAKHIFLWTYYYDEEKITAHDYERPRFVAHDRHFSNGVDYTYHSRLNDLELFKNDTYQGGLLNISNWLTLHDIVKALSANGFEILKQVPDSHNNIPAMNIFASKVV